MATSAPPPASASTAPRPTQQPNPAFNGTQRFVPPRQQPSGDDDEREEEDPNPPNPPVFTFPQQPGQIQPGVFNNQQGTFNGQPMIVNPQVMPPQGAPAAPAYPYPSMPVPAPFGSSTPGSINAPPQPTPGQVRPPGGQRQ
jgi:hypothetical protein